MPEAEAERHAPKPRRSGVVVPNQPRWFERLGAALLAYLLRLLGLTIRWRVNDRAGLLQGPTPVPQAIFCIWHNRLALAMAIYAGYVRYRVGSRKLAALVSASRDGAILAYGLERSGARPVRGSTSRRGPQALLELVSAAEEGCHLAITPDGPRGPRYVVQPGVISLAQITGLPIVPASFHLNWKYCLKSWDQFQVPWPFARCRLETAEPVRVPRDASAEERERLRQLVEQRMREITRD